MVGGSCGRRRSGRRGGPGRAPTPPRCHTYAVLNNANNSFPRAHSCGSATSPCSADTADGRQHDSHAKAHRNRESVAPPARGLVVGAAIVDSLTHPTRLLAAQRSYPENIKGKWEFPGGKVEEGEYPEAALHREIFEELGCSIRIGAQISPDRDTPGDWPLPNGRPMRLWLAELDPAGPAPHCGDSHDTLVWLTWAEATKLDWLPGDVQMLPALGTHFIKELRHS
ncbi:NUDIX domain-containing protein [Arcanobacterium haemolyticum]|nr:NUDIX domain-containing protein [Arcanobacterium haemolyticum]